MLALYRAGRQGEALRVFQEGRAGGAHDPRPPAGDVAAPAGG
jgi:hypothetical protein